MPVVQMKATSANSIKIEKGVPVPDRRGNNKYPWADMEVGDSFFVVTDKIANFKRNVYAKNRNGKEFTACAEGDGCRVWRTA